MEAERWLPVPGYEGRYEVSDHGRVRSFVPARGRHIPHVLGRDSALWAYPRVTLTAANGKVSTRTIHQLVLEAFVGPKPALGHAAHTRHLDGDVTNNRASNLRWGTAKENMEDRERHGNTARGARSGNSRLLSTSAVDEIRRRVVAGESQTAVARDFGICQPQVSLISRGLAWAWHPFPEPPTVVKQYDENAKGRTR